MAKGGPIDRDKLYEEIATKLGIPKEKVEEVVDHEFRFVKKVMERGEFNSVRLPRFGIFEVNEKRLKNVERYGD